MKLKLFFIIFLLLSSPAEAENIVVSSLEWLTDTSSAVGIYTVNTCKIKEVGCYVCPYECSVILLRTLKNIPPEERTIIYYNYTFDINDIGSGDQILVFFSEDDHGEKQVIHQINLDKPQKRGDQFIAVTSEFELLTEKDKILGIVETRLKEFPNQKVLKYGEWPKVEDRFEIEIPIDNPVYTPVNSGSGCYLVVPEDLKEKAKQKAKELEDIKIFDLRNIGK